MTEDKRQRALDRLEELAGRGLDLTAFWHEVSDVITPLVPHDGGTCCYTLDPASLLITSHVNREMPVLPREFLEIEYGPGAPHDLAAVVRSPAGTSTLHEAAGGEPESTARWQANHAFGGDQELLVGLRTRSGEPWGGLGLYRFDGRPHFDADERRFLRAAAPALAEGARRGLVRGEAEDPEGPEAPAVLVLGRDGEIESATPGAAQWLEALDGSTAVRSVALRVLMDNGEAAVARVRTASGGWAVVHGSPLLGGGADRVAVVVEAGRPERITPLLMSAYGLTEREQDVTRLVLKGEPTAAIAERLMISPFTVQEHLKHVFEKTGVRSRRELVSRVFFSLYEPRLRDNETRMADGRPLRGGPMPTTP